MRRKASRARLHDCSREALRGGLSGRVRRGLKVTSGVTVRPSIQLNHFYSPEIVKRHLRNLLHFLSNAVMAAALARNDAAEIHRRARHNGKEKLAASFIQCRIRGRVRRKQICALEPLGT